MQFHIGDYHNSENGFIKKILQSLFSSAVFDFFFVFGVFRTERFFVVTSCHARLELPVSDGGV